MKVLVPAHVVVCLVLLFPVLGFSVGHSRSAESGHVIRLASYNVYFGKLGRPELMDELAAMPENTSAALAGRPPSTASSSRR